MNKIFSKVAALSVGLAMAIGVGVAVSSKGVREVKADSESFVPTDFTTTAGEQSVTHGNVTTTITNGVYNVKNSDFRVYANASMTVSVSGDNSITGITFDGRLTGKNAVSNFSVDVGSFSSPSWSGSASSVTFSCTTQTQITGMTVTYSSGGGGGTTTYTVTYNANGGTGTLTDPNSPYDEESIVTVLANTFTNPGYSFTGWNTQANGSGTSYVAGNIFTITSSTTLYAQWSLDQKYIDDTTAKTITWDLSVPSYTSASADQVSWESPRVNMTADKAEASTATNNYLPPAQSSSRFYKNSTLTFAPQGEDGILSIEATATTENYASVLSSSTWTNATAEVSSTDSKVVVITVIEGYENVSATIGNTVGLNGVVVHYGIPTPVTKYEVIDRIDDGSLNVTEVAEGTTLNATIIPEDGYALPESVSVLMAGNPVEFTYSNGVVTVQNVQGNITIDGACIKVNQIQYLYSKSSGASVDVYGVYVGFLDGTGPVIMDGEYGIVVYNKTADVSSYTERETILHVTGSISIYKGLYEIGSATIAEATFVPEESVPSTPVVYATKGGETADYASRLTTVTGVPTVTSGNFDSDAGTADIKMNFVVGGNNIQVFYKKAAQTADAETFAAAKAAVEESSEITIKGFTGWYDGFQVQMNGYVKPAEDYTAEEFAQDLLTQTDAVCTGWKEGDNNHDAIEAIWSNLASNDKYPALPSDQKTILAEAARDESGTVVERAMARYDFLTGKYNLSNFINGRTPVATANTRFGETDLAASDNTMIIVVTIAAVSALAFTTLLVFKKKRQK